MGAYLLDTNHLSPLVTQEHKLGRIVALHLIDGDHLGIATPSLAELLYGIGVLPRSKSNFEEWRKFSETFRYYEVNREIAERSARLRVELGKRGHQLKVIDSMIAVIALYYQLTL